MPPIGIIANPASGKDIRRLAAFGSVFDNNEKVRIVRRVLLGLDAMGARDVFIMPDTFGIGVRAMEDLDIGLKANILDGFMEGTQDDTTRAADKLRDLGAACIITLGGDGTNRAAAKGAGEVPLLPISTGTNNVFPCMTESTLAGIAAGILAVHPEYQAFCVRLAPMLEIRRGGELMDLALVDVVVSKPGFIGARALWEVSSLLEIFLARPEPGHIGFSSVGGHLGLAAGPNRGMHLVIGPGFKNVLAPIAPGLIRTVPVQSCRVIAPGEEIPISHEPALAALDGERELSIKAGDGLTVSLSLHGPKVVDIASAIGRASTEGLFIEPLF
ncbi:MAG: NAD(+)/NADH kinase [Pseudomonadota bacterium]